MRLIPGFFVEVANKGSSKCRWLC